jgi:hypothetical protein
MRGNGKRPVCKWRPRDEDSGKRRQLTLEEAKAAWALLDRRDAMPGVAVEAVGAVIVDLDAKLGGAKNFEALCSERGIDVGSYPMVRTPTGGVHLFFADPEGRWRNSASRLAPGVDTRGVGGYVVAPGAYRHDFGLYEPLRPATLAELVDIVANQRLPSPPPPLANLLDAHCRAPPLRAPLIRAPEAFTIGAAVNRPRRDFRTDPTRPLTQSAVFADLPGDWDDLSAGVPERWTLEGALAAVAAAAPGTRNDTFAREAFTAGLRAQALGLDPDPTVDALIEAAKLAGSDDAKTVDTIARCFSAGAAKADEKAAPVAAAATACVPGAPRRAAVGRASPPSSRRPKREIAIATAKAQARGAYELGLVVSRDTAFRRLVKFCAMVEGDDVRRELAKSLAVLLSRDDWSFNHVRSTCAFLSFAPAEAVAVAAWAARTASGNVALDPPSFKQLRG